MNDLSNPPHPASAQTKTEAATPTTAEVAAFVLGKALGQHDLSPADALAALTVRVEVLRDPLSQEALDEMRQHLPVLDALFHRLSVEALKPRPAEHQALLLRTALQAQQAYARVFTLLHGLQLQALGRGRVLVGFDDSDGADGPSLDGDIGNDGAP